MDETSDFWKIVKESFPDAKITNFIVICEIENEESMAIRINTSDKMTPWLASGMIEYAVRILEGDSDD